MTDVTVTTVDDPITVTVVEGDPVEVTVSFVGVQGPPGADGAGGAGGGHTIQENGSDLTDRANLNFGAGLTASDNAGDDSTDVAAEVTQAELDVVQADIDAHELAAAPHSGHAATAHAHAGEDITSGTVADARIASTIARDSEVTAAADAAQAAAEATADAALTAHEGAADPHAVYLTGAEGDAAYEPAGAVATHEADTTDVHGIADTSTLETTSGAQAKVDAHAALTSDDAVHGLNADDLGRLTDALQGVYVAPGALRTWQRTRKSIRNVAWAGESTVEGNIGGFNLINGGEGSTVEILAGMLNPSAGAGFQGLWRDEWSLSAGWAQVPDADYDLAPFGEGYIANPGGSTVIATFTRPADVTIAAVEFVFADNASFGTPSVRFNGAGAWTNVAGLSGPTISEVVRSRFYVTNPDTIEIRAATAAGAAQIVVLLGIYIYALDPDVGEGIVCHNLAVSSETLANWQRPVTALYARPHGVLWDLDPDLLILGPWSNDSVASTTFEDNLRAAIKAVQTRTVTDAVTNGSTTVTSATARFVASSDEGKFVAGTNIPADTRIENVQTATQITLSQAATGSSTGTLTIIAPATPDILIVGQMMQGTARTQADVGTTNGLPTITGPAGAFSPDDVNRTITATPGFAGTGLIGARFLSVESDQNATLDTPDIGGATISITLQGRPNTTNQEELRAHTKAVARGISVTDAVTVDADATVTSATAAFAQEDIGKFLHGLGVTEGTYIYSVTSATEIEMSRPAIGSGTGLLVADGFAYLDIGEAWYSTGEDNHRAGLMYDALHPSQEGHASQALRVKRILDLFSGSPGATDDPELIDKNYALRRAGISDDFWAYKAGATPDLDVLGNSGWIVVLTTGVAETGSFSQGVTEAFHPGVVVIRNGTGNTNTATADAGSGVTAHIGNASADLGNGPVPITICIKMEGQLSTAAQEYVFRFGLGDTTDGTDYTDGVYIEYDRLTNGTNWQCKTASGGTRTTTDSGVAVPTSTWVTFKLDINADATQVDFYIGTGGQPPTLVATHTTNIPATGTCGPHFDNHKTAGTVCRGYRIDVFELGEAFAQQR